ncbi:uncharacterized protein LOC113216744 [Frankliniella occidentalis]|uniref:Uncharacterized protein LOC113216744 n=1 Tax=Frankliniella occidentalis TaxID=133901 RepID=A0A6J1TNF8_FRAOC|nr:uncharacterized protein LOC113216744 [Frankliniella occidentalis]
MPSTRESGSARPAHGGSPNGHRLNTMDNAAFDAHGEAAQRAAMTTVELGEMGAVAPRAASGAPRTNGTNGTAGGAPLCKPDLCRAMAPQILGKPPAMRPNPWHRYKTVLLVATVAGLVIWAVVYGLFANKWQST